MEYKIVVGEMLAKRVAGRWGAAERRAQAPPRSRTLPWPAGSEPSRFISGIIRERITLQLV